MRYKTLGRTELKVPVMGFGCGAFGDMYGGTTQENCNELVAMALDAGINYFDTAPSYGPEGLSEIRLGKAIRGIPRDRLIINTKCGRYDHGAVGAPSYEYVFDAARTRTELENSLRRIGTDYIDVYQIHDVNNCPDLRFIVEETVPELEKLREEGKIRFIGITGTYLDTLSFLLDHTSLIDTVLNFCRYNLIDTSLRGYFTKYIEERDIGLINASILYMGMLTSNLKTLQHWRSKKMLDPIRAAVKKANVLCEAAGTSLPEQAFLFGMDMDEAASTLVGMSNPRSLKRNLETLKKPRNPELEEELLEIFRGTSIFPDHGQIDGKTTMGSYSDKKN